MLFTKISFIFAVFSSGMMVTSTLMSADWHKNEGKSLYDARKEEILLKLQHLIDTVDKVEGGLADLINRADIFDEISGTDQVRLNKNSMDDDKSGLLPGNGQKELEQKKRKNKFVRFG